jgi:hypothetical protein
VTIIFTDKFNEKEFYAERKDLQNEKGKCPARARTEKSRGGEDEIRVDVGEADDLQAEEEGLLLEKG